MIWPVFPHEAMATFFEITIAGQAPTYARQAAAAAFRELDRLEGELSRYIESSDIARANRLAHGETIAIGDDALECLLIAADAALATGRAFDPAYASVRTPDFPADAPPFTLNPDAHTLTSLAVRLHLDLGAVGKGYALAEWNITSACLNSGGSTALALSPPATHAGWPIGIGEGASQRTLSLAHSALSGSGVAVKGSHLIDPRTGAPAIRRTRAWAFASSGALADALSTAFFVMAESDVAAFCSAYPGIGAALVGAGDRLTVLGALRGPAGFPV